MEDPRLSIIGDLYEANFSNELRTNLLTRVRDLLGGCHAGILVMDINLDRITHRLTTQSGYSESLVHPLRVRRRG